ncbi:MAG: hypothetical protein N2515_08970, partial [Deltaproteobacteria bacterium]|nr:hypothetical protein [Deltaproteobacteria bacterium]
MLAPPPPPIQELERACIEYVRRALGIELDRSPETLPILDHYLLNLVRSTQVEPILDLVSRCAGAYFGEVVRHAMGQGRWCISSEHPGEWRLEMEHVFLYFFPVGMVREVIAGTPLPEWYG